MQVPEEVTVHESLELDARKVVGSLIWVLGTEHKYSTAEPFLQSLFVFRWGLTL